MANRVGSLATTEVYSGVPRRPLGFVQIEPQRRNAVVWFGFVRCNFGVDTV